MSQTAYDALLTAALPGDAALLAALTPADERPPRRA
jgi:hypothetical protein